MSSLTQVLNAVAGLVQGTGVKLQSNNGKDENGEHDEQADLHQGCQGLED